MTEEPEPERDISNLTGAGNIMVKASNFRNAVLEACQRFRRVAAEAAVRQPVASQLCNCCVVSESMTNSNGRVEATAATR